MIRSAVVASAALSVAVGMAPAAGAFPEEFDKPYCHTTPTGSLIDQRGYMTLCDSEPMPDGSWDRVRIFWGESNRFCNRGPLGNRRCMDMPGGMHIYNQEVYHVTPDAVPPGEPGMLG